MIDTMKQTMKLMRILCICLGVLLVLIIGFKFPTIKKKVSFELSMHKKYSQIEYQTKKISISGVKKDYTFLYIADTHTFVKTREDLGSMGTAENRAKLFCNENNVNSTAQFPDWIRLANRKKVTAVLMGGDIVDYASDENYDYIHKYLNGLDMPYLYTMGNHDATMPWENRYDYTNPKLLSFFQKEDYECQYLEYPDLIICSVNDSEGSISAKALKEFKKVYKKNKPMILILHIPLNTERTKELKEETTKVWKLPILIGENTSYGLDDPTKEFLSIVLQKNGNVKEVLAGHIHFYHVDQLNDSIQQIVSDGSYKGKGIILNIHGK